MTNFEKLIEIKNQAETDGRLGKISVESAQKIVADVENTMRLLTVEELAETAKDL